MSQDELRLIDEVRAAYLDRTKIGCTGCRYCMPCPNGVNIPGVFAAWNDVSLYDVKPLEHYAVKEILEEGRGADRCLACGACEATCPQHLEIISKLQQAWREFGL